MRRSGSVARWRAMYRSKVPCAGIVVVDRAPRCCPTRPCRRPRCPRRTPSSRTRRRCRHALLRCPVGPSRSPQVRSLGVSSLEQEARVSRVPAMQNGSERCVAGGAWATQPTASALRDTRRLGACGDRPPVSCRDADGATSLSQATRRRRGEGQARAARRAPSRLAVRPSVPRRSSPGSWWRSCCRR